MTLKLYFWCLLAFFALTTASYAQDPNAQSTLQTAYRQSWYLRATLSDSSVVQGRIRTAPADSVHIGGATRAVDRIVRLERRTREGGKALTGGIVGGLVVGGFSAALISGFCEYECGAEAILGVGFGFALGGGVGALIGEFLSPAELRWHRVWPN